MAFLLMGILGVVAGGSFLANFISHGQFFHLISAGTIPVLNIIIGVKVAMSLFLVLWVIAVIQVKEGEQV